MVGDDELRGQIDRNRTDVGDSLRLFDIAHVTQLLTATKIVATTIVSASDAQLKDYES